MDIEIHHYIHYDNEDEDNEDEDNGLDCIQEDLTEVLNKLDEIIIALKNVQKKENEEMADLTALTAQVKANTDAEASAIVLLNGLSDQLKAVANDPAAVAALADQLKTSSDKLAAAIVADTPAA